MIGAPSSAGAYGPGQEHAPAAFRRYGLLPRLRDSGIDVVDRGDGTLRPWSVDETTPSASDVGSVMDTVRASWPTPSTTPWRRTTPCSSWAATARSRSAPSPAPLRDGSSVALAYIDLDADLNTPQTGDGVLDWMGVAHLLDVPGAHDEPGVDRVAAPAAESPTGRPAVRGPTTSPSPSSR